jgi:hypothetical protein
MKYIRLIATVVGLLIASGAIASAQADDNREKATLFTPRLSGDHFVCSAVNVSHKTLRIAFAVLGVDGNLLTMTLPGSDANPTPNPFNVSAGTEAEIDLRFTSGIPPTDGYCKVEVSGSGDRNDVRVDLQVYWTKPIIPGTTSPIIQLARTVQGY